MTFAVGKDFCRNLPRWLALLLPGLFLLSDIPAAENSKPPAPAKWVTLKGCRYLPQDYNDGDSFHAKYGQREFIFRLYFVDAPELDESIAERVREHALRD